METQNLIVTHIINPQTFWYRNISVPNEKVDVLEKEIAELYVRKVAERNWHFEIDEVVAVYFLPWKKFIRGRLVSKANLSYKEEYIIWALDYGLPFQTKVMYVHPLSSKYAINADHIRKGGLACLFAAEKEFDFIKNQIVLNQKNEWHHRACELFEMLVMSAVKVTFLEQFQTPDGQYWGDLTIVTSEGELIDASEYLKSYNFAISAGPNFRSLCLSLHAVRKSCWLSNNNNYKLRKNVVGAKFINCFDTCSNPTKQKIEEWFQRNDADTDSVVESVGSAVGFDDDADDDDDDCSDDVSLKGSASCIRRGSKNSLRSNAKSTNKTFSTVDLPRPSALNAFEIAIEKCGAIKSELNNIKHKECIAEKQTKSEAAGQTSNVGKHTVAELTHELDAYNLESGCKKAVTTAPAQNRKERDAEEYIEPTDSEARRCAILFQSTPIGPDASTSKVSQDFIYPDFEAIRRSIATQNNPNKCLDVFRMLPAGFNLSNLDKYRDEKNHWHCKKSTRNDTSPHSSYKWRNQRRNKNTATSTSLYES